VNLSSSIAQRTAMVEIRYTILLVLAGMITIGVVRGYGAVDCSKCDSKLDCRSGVCHNGRCGTRKNQIILQCYARALCQTCVTDDDCRSGSCPNGRCGSLHRQAGRCKGPLRDDCSLCSKDAECQSGACHHGRCGTRRAQFRLNGCRPRVVPESKTVLQIDGFATSIIHIPISMDRRNLDKVEIRVGDPEVITHFSAFASLDGQGLYNVTVAFEFEGNVGESKYEVIMTTTGPRGKQVHSLIASGTFQVAGIVLQDSTGTVVSGNSNPLSFRELSLDKNGILELSVMSFPSDPSRKIDFSETLFSVISSSDGASTIVQYTLSSCQPLTGESSLLLPGCGVGFDQKGSKMFIQFDLSQTIAEPLNIEFLNPSLRDPETGDPFRGTLVIDP